MHGSSQMSCPAMNGQPSQGFSIDNNYCSQDRPSLKPQRAANKKNVSRRGTAFTKEDLVVCSAFLNISKDPITGVNQTSGGYYKRMHDYFNEHKPEGSNRSQIAVQHRWALIQKAMNKFCGLKEDIDRQNESGKNKQDRIDDAVQMYETNEPFTIMHCWKKLRNVAKWTNKFLELNNSTSPDGMSSPPTQGHAESGNENIDTSRPEGRDSAKRRRSKSFTETSSSSTTVEVLQRLQEQSEKTEQKQDQQMAEIFSRKDEKIKIQRDLFNLQKKHMKMSMQQKKKENAFREKESEAQLISAESGIMSIDIEKVPPHLKNYYLGMQRLIMER
uniref:NAM-like protein n=1 Tax=Saccharum hybrid cultivar SP80-3280 TaxID=193079 RepID=A0A4P2THW6_9POAL|nr:NAM-like protein [Saccharum hybrid cultivar SP80-3280]